MIAATGVAAVDWFFPPPTLVMAGFERTNMSKRNAGFTLAEVVVSLAILSMALASMMYGYVQTNAEAQWSSMSLAAESLASQSVEQARAAKWDLQSGTSGTGLGTSDELPAPTNFTQIFTNAFLVPATGQSVSVTNYVSVTTAYSAPPVRQIRADCVWHFPSTGAWFTNTVITYRISE
jgi:prepilin-type N-terminal cleavage/methylation domain-containing protein